MLMLLENYVLNCIGALPPASDAKLAEMVQKVWGGDADWKKTLRRELDMADTIDGHIQEMWTRNQAIAAQRQEQLHPVQFAKMVVDSNWPEIGRHQDR